MDEDTPQIPPVNKPEEGNVAEKTEPPKQEVPKRRISNKAIWRIILVLLFILIPLVIYFVKDIQLIREKDKNKQETLALINQATSLIDQRNEMYLMQIAKSMVWTVQSGFISNDTSGLFKFLSEFVKEKECKTIILVNEEGRVFLATDIRLNGELFAKDFGQKYISNNETKVFRKGNRELLVSSPVMVKGSRIGTVVLISEPEAYSLTVTEGGK